MRVPLPEVPQQRVLTDWVTASVRKAILGGYFEPGEKVDQELIARELQVSRTPVREALGKLEAEGYVETRPHRGAFVMMPSREDVAEIYEVLGIVETEVVRQVTPLIPDSLLDRMAARLAEDQARFERGSASAYLEGSTPRFPASIFQFTKNRLLREIMEGLSNRAEMLLHLLQVEPGSNVAESLLEHEAILEAMRERDADRAAELTQYHLQNSARRMLSWME